MKKILLSLFLVLSTIGATAQIDSIVKLEEVVVSDVRIKRYADGHKVTELSDSTITRGSNFLTRYGVFPCF